MSYQVLARKWRPQTFAEVVGQEHIARTLKNALISNRIGHAYLFVGSRGIGKTTSARIFAKALNCEHPIEGEPCCQCDSCKEIAAGSSLDVIEIDAASHNGIDDMRNIRDQVLYPPVKSKYKVYIIDEVHMLSTGAWNALLKTLEEPPEYVKFLFATTEPHKVLPTIISRCQRFDLHRIPVPLIMGRLRQIADADKIFVEDGALAVIARAAEGGMRDAQSIFDQMIAFCGGSTEAETIRESDVISIFGLASGAELREMAVGLIQNDLPKVLSIIATIADAGRDLERVFEDFMEYFRNLMLAGLCQDAEKFLEVSKDELLELRQLAASATPALIRKILAALVSQQRLFNDCLNKRIALEVVAAQIATEVHSTNLDDVLTHLNVISGLIPKEEVAPRVPPAIIRNSECGIRNPEPSPAAPAAIRNPEPSPAAPAAIRNPEPSPAAPTAPAACPETQLASPPVQPEVECTDGVPIVENKPPVVAEMLPPMTEESRDYGEEGAPATCGPADGATPYDALSHLQAILTTTEVQPEEPRQLSALERSGYRRATKEERAEMQNHPAVKTVMKMLHNEPYDAIIPQ